MIDNNSNWAVCGKSSGVVSMPVAAMATHKVHMEVMPLFAGHLPFPSIRVFRYLPPHSSPVIPPDTGLTHDASVSNSPVLRLSMNPEMSLDHL